MSYEFSAHVCENLGDDILISFSFYIFSEVGDSPTEQVTEDPDSEVYPSEDGECFFLGILFIRIFVFRIR